MCVCCDSKGVVINTKTEDQRARSHLHTLITVLTFNGSAGLTGSPPDDANSIWYDRLGAEKISTQTTPEVLKIIQVDVVKRCIEKKTL